MPCRSSAQARHTRQPLPSFSCVRAAWRPSTRCCCLAVHHDSGMLTIDAWAELKASPHVGVLVKLLRQELSALLARKISNPALELTADKAVQATMQLLAMDGF